MARNYINPLDHALAGGIMAAVYRFNMGPKGKPGINKDFFHHTEVYFKKFV